MNEVKNQLFAHYMARPSGQGRLDLDFPAPVQQQRDSTYVITAYALHAFDGKTPANRTLSNVWKYGS